MSVPAPFVSGVLICGDTGTKTIAAAIASVTSRALVDEVIVGFNGKVGRGLIPSESHGVPVRVFDAPWKRDFAAARNEAHAHARGEWHWRWDTDDVLLPAAHVEVARKASEVKLAPPFAATSRDQFYASLRQLQSQGTNCVVSPYYYQVDDQDRPIIEHPVRRIVRWSAGWRWHRKLHEDLEPVPPNTERWVYDPTLIFKQHQDPAEDRGARNAEIHAEFVRELEAQGEGASYRDWYNAGAMAADAGKYGEACTAFSKALPKALAANDPGFVLAVRESWIGSSCVTGGYDVALSLAFDALRDDPAARHGYFFVSMVHWHRKEFQACVEWFRNGIARPAAFSFAPHSKLTRVVLPLIYAADALSNLGQHIEAERLAAEAVTEGPWSAEAARLKAEIDARRERTVLNGSVERLKGYWAPRDATKAALAELLRPSAPPAPVTPAQFAESMKASAKLEGSGALVGRSRGSAQRIFTIVAPSYAEPWEPEDAEDKGLGGSEEAILYLGEELAKRGHRVEVFGPFAERREAFGVTWRPLSAFNAAGSYDVLIAHRSVLPAHLGERVCVWHHDHERLPGCDAPGLRHLFVSNWQRERLALPGVVIGNGVPASQVAHKYARMDEGAAKRVVYCSQPVRGLGALLDFWPKVLEAEPEAWLDVYYGFRTNEKLAERGVPGMREAVEAIKQRCTPGALPPRVRIRGSVGHSRLMYLLRSAGIWCYPTDYPETFCIAGLRAAAAGCRLVYKEAGALPETLGRFTPPADDWRETLLNALATPIGELARVGQRATVLATATWAHVADRLLAAL